MTSLQAPKQRVGLHYAVTTNNGAVLPIKGQGTRDGVDQARCHRRRPALRVLHWVSVNTNNMRIRFGKGEMLRGLMLLEYQWNAESTCALKSFSKDLRHVDIESTVKDHIQVMQIPAHHARYKYGRFPWSAVRAGDLAGR